MKKNEPLKDSKKQIEKKNPVNEIKPSTQQNNTAKKS